VLEKFACKKQTASESLVLCWQLLILREDLLPVKPVALLYIFSSYVDLLTLCVVLSAFWSVGFLWIWGRILFEGLMDDDSQETAGRKP
jgi:hypothetical protein